MTNATKQRGEPQSRGELLAWQIKFQHDDLTRQVAKHLADVRALRALPEHDRTGIRAQDTAFYERYEGYIDHILCELEEGI